ncbi:galactose-specific lectin nattectin-like [Periophthalmus magnuspinnatus]|uniref:galactose-specific lectin nattectin-like n=1 Tax=Periophthalmus magnuspinnatus TaxID=409849 RepID=UPI002436C36A|nr:galactose-specific lectin nattectin-like [Periophthalmus magnuspinnatus]
MGNAPNSWRWSATGKINPDAYQNWMSTQPDNFRSQQHCVTMRNGQWTDDNCKSSFPFVCFTGSTEPGLKEFTYVSTSMTWAAAKNHCRQNYTDLAMIQDDAENTAVASVISSSTNVWIGLYRVPWVWSNGKISSFVNWAPGEPDNLDGAEHCAWVHENHQWSDESCSFMGPFFCQQILDVKKYHLKIKLQTDAVLSDPASYNQIIQQLGVKFKNMALTDFQFTWKTSYPNM